MCVCVCVRVPVARVPLSTTPTHPRMAPVVALASRLPSPAGTRHPAAGQLLDRSAAALKEGLPGRAWWEREKAPKATRFCTEPWQNHNDSCGSAPPWALHAAPARLAFNFPAAESFPPPSPSAGDEQGKVPVAGWRGAVCEPPLRPVGLIVCLTCRTLFVGKLTVIETEERMRYLDRLVVGHVTVHVK